MKKIFITIFIATLFFGQAAYAKKNPKAIDLKVPDAESLIKIVEANSQPAETAVEITAAQPSAMPAATPEIVPEQPQNILSDMPNKNPVSNNILTNAKKGEVSWVRAVLGFIFVASMIFVMASLLKKNSGKLGVLTKNRPLKVIQSLSLGLKKQIALIDVNGTQIVVGVTASGLNMIYESKSKNEKIEEKPAEIANELPIISVNAIDESEVKKSETPTFAEKILMEEKNITTSKEDAAFSEELQKIIKSLKPLQHNQAKVSPASGNNVFKPFKAGKEESI